MKVLLDIWSLATENGGPTRSAKGLAKALALVGCDVVLMSHVPGKVSPEEVAALASAGVKYVEGRSNNYRIALADARQVLREVKPDLVHTQGLWKLSTHAMNMAAQELKIPVVISPRGMLDPWALSVKKWKKRLGLFLYQKGDLKHAAAFHATADMEAEHIRVFGLKQPIIVAPNGVEVPEIEPRNTRNTRKEHVALFLSRLHPGKGLLLLAEAWAQVRPQGWKMRVVGPDRYGHLAEVKKRVAELGIESAWEFQGEANEAHKWELFSQADLFVHPSVSENFGISIAEALACGVSVITTTGAPWRDLVTHQCGWWIERSVENLAAVLREAVMLSDDTRIAMGERGRQLIAEQYSWSAIGRRMLDGYRQLVNRK